MRFTNLAIGLLLAGNILLGLQLITRPAGSPFDSSDLPAPSAASLEAATQPDPAAAPNPADAKLAEENAALRQEINDLKAELSAYNARRTRPKTTSPNASARPLPADPLFRMLENEETAGLALDWIEADQSKRFASLIALTRLNPAEKADLLKLLTDRYANRADIDRIGSDALPPEERVAFESEYQRRLQNIVGEDMAALFLKAETKPLSFARIQEIDTRLRYDAEPLSPEQYLPIWNLLSSTIQVGVSTGTPDSAASFAATAIENNLGILAEAQRILSPTQYQAFEARIQEDITQIRVRDHFMQENFRRRAEQERQQVQSSEPSPQG